MIPMHTITSANSTIAPTPNIDTATTVITANIISMIVNIVNNIN